MDIMICYSLKGVDETVIQLALLTRNTFLDSLPMHFLLYPLGLRCRLATIIRFDNNAVAISHSLMSTAIASAVVLIGWLFDGFCNAYMSCAWFE